MLPNKSCRYGKNIAHLFESAQKVVFWIYKKRMINFDNRVSDKNNNNWSKLDLFRSNAVHIVFAI
jgi:hypothetical protein